MGRLEQPKEVQRLVQDERYSVEEALKIVKEKGDKGV